MNVTVTSSIAGIIIPPSHNMIVFAIAAGGGISISKLFLAGVVPGILMCMCHAAAAYIVAVKRGYSAEKFPGWLALTMAFFGAVPGLLTTAIIAGGVLSGVFTVTESGAFGAIYAFLVTLPIYCSITVEKFKTAVVQSVRTTAMVMLLIACAVAFAYMLTFYGVPVKTVDLLTGLTDNPILILLVINLVLLILGMIMDMAALILICTPIFLSVANSLGIEPLQFGMILLVNLGLGLFTLPVGKLLMDKAVRTIWPFLYRHADRFDVDYICSGYFINSSCSDRRVGHCQPIGPEQNFCFKTKTPSIRLFPTEDVSKRACVILTGDSTRRF